MTRKQLALIHTAKRQLDLNEPSYRMVLNNVGGVASSKDLDNTAFEDVMAVLESMGFGAVNDQLATHWRTIVERRGRAANPRMVRMIRQLAASDAGRRYPLPAMSLRMSEDRTDQVEKLYPREAWNLIEAYKAINSRDNCTAGENPRAAGEGQAREVPA